jgi:hypothetical protein
MSDWEKVLIKKRLWSNLSLTFRIFKDQVDNRISLMLYQTEPETETIYLWFIVWKSENKFYMIVKNYDYFNTEYLMQDYKLWDFVDYINLWKTRLPIYEINLEEMFKYDPEWVAKLKSMKIWWL